MARPAALQEPMDMPDPYFPVKTGICKGREYGQLLFPNHWHQHFEILYFLSGKALIEINSITYEMQAGDAAIINSNDLHAGICLSDDLAYYVLIADLSLLHSPSPDSVETKFITPLVQNRILFRNKTSGQSEFGECLLSIVRELEERKLGYELSVKSHLYRVLTLLLRHDVEQVLTEVDYAQRMKTLERFEPVFQDIEEHYQKPVTIEQLAGRARLSRFHFSRLFKELTGRTVTQYINGIRLNRAEYLLCNTDLTISEIAYETGFHDIYYFSRKFKQVKKVSPSEARKRKSP